MSSSLSLSLSCWDLSFYLSFSASIFYRYSLSYLRFSINICLSWSISSCSLLTSSTSCLNCSFYSIFFLIFSSWSCLSLLSFSIIILLFISLCFSTSLSSNNLTCYSYKLSYILPSCCSLPFLCLFSWSYLSSSSLMSLFLSLSLIKACFYSS